MAAYAAQKAEALGMNGWVIEAKAIIARSSTDKDKAQFELKQTLTQLQSRLSNQHSISLGQRYGQKQ